MCPVALALFVSVAAFGQVNEGTYYAFHPIKADVQPDVISVEALSLLTGVIQFTDDETRKGLNGTYHLAISHTRYAVADFKNGILNGNWTQYHNNQPEQKGTFIGGVYDGLFWEKTSAGHTEYHFQNGEIRRLDAWFDNGQLQQSQQRDEHGKLDGEVIRYYSDGKVAELRNYIHGKQEGPQMDQSFGVRNYTLKDGVMVGPYSEMTEDGGLLRRGNFDEKGEKIGIWTYGSGGDMSREENYVNGVLDGVRKDYYSKGKLWHYDEYKNGKRDGKSIEYSHTTGKPFVEYVYRDDKLHGEYKVWQGEKLFESGLYRDGVLVMKKTYSDGKLRDIYLLDERGSLARVEGYNEAGKRIYRNTTFKKHPTIALVETSSGVVDVVRE